MAIFAIIQQPGPGGEKLLGAVVKAYQSAHYPLGSGIYLVSDTGTAIDVSNKVGITPGAEAGSAIVFEVGSYYGRANPAIWSWVKSNWEGAPLG